MIASLFSSFFLAIMILVDGILIGPCYKRRPHQAWFVSSIMGVILGLAATFIAWMAVSSHTFADSWVYFVSLWQPFGMLVLLSGILSCWLLFHYFACFTADAGDSAEIAAYFAATPVFVLAAVTFARPVFEYVSLPFPISPILLSQAVAVVITTLGLVMLAYLSGHRYKDVGKYRLHLILMIVLNTLYTIVLDVALALAEGASNATATDVALGLLPYYWLGFALGFFVMATKKSRREWRENLPTIKQLALPILVVEILGMLVFFFEIFGLSTEGPTLVATIIGLHALLVLVATVGIRAYAKKLDRNKTVLTISKCAITPKDLRFSLPISQNFGLQALAITLILLGIPLWFL